MFSNLHRQNVLCRSILLLFLCSCIACSNSMSKAPEPNVANSEQHDIPMSDQDLIKLVDNAAVALGSPEFLEKLGSFPRDNLLARLTEIRDRLAPDDHLRPEIAFVFCYLKYEYADNRSIVVSGLYGPPQRYRGFAKDNAIGTVGALIKWGDKGLLKTVFASATHADAAFAEGVQDVLDQEMWNDPENFLVTLKDQPLEVKERIYDLIEWYDSPENRKFMEYLKGASARPETAQISKELMKVLKAKDQKRDKSI